MYLTDLYVCGVYYDVFVESYSSGSPHYYTEDGLQKGDDPEFEFSISIAYIKDKNGVLVEIPDDLYEYLINDSYIYNKLDELAYNEFLTSLHTYGI